MAQKTRFSLKSKAAKAAAVAAEEEEERIERRIIEIPEDKCKQTKTLKKVLLKAKDCDEEVEEEIIPYVIKDDGDKREIKIRKKIAVDYEKEEDY